MVYQYIDSSLVRLANIVVKSWTKSTGRTRADLANAILATGTITAPLMAYAHTRNPDILYGLCTTPLQLSIMRNNNKLDEAGATGREYDNYRTHKHAKKGFGAGPIVAGLGAGTLSKLGDSTQHQSAELVEAQGTLDYLAIFGLSLGISNYIMRAAYVTPQKLQDATQQASFSKRTTRLVNQ